MQNKSRLLATLAGVLAVLGIGGAGLAWAQEPPTTTAPSTESSTPDASAARADRPGCDRDGDGVADTPPTEAPVTDETSV